MTPTPEMVGSNDVPWLAWALAIFAIACAHDGQRWWEAGLTFASVAVVIRRLR